MLHLFSFLQCALCNVHYTTCIIQLALQNSKTETSTPQLALSDPYYNAMKALYSRQVVTMYNIHTDKTNSNTASARSLLQDSNFDAITLMPCLPHCNSDSAATNLQLLHRNFLPVEVLSQTPFLFRFFKTFCNQQ